MNNNFNHIDEIKSRLNAVNKKEGIKESLTGFFLFLSISLLLLLTLIFIESIWHFNSNIRSIIFYSFILISTSQLFYLTLWPLLKGFGIFTKPNYFDIAARVGLNFPNVKDELLNSLQLITGINYYKNSTLLIEKAFERSYEMIKPLNFNSIIDLKKTKRYLRIALSIIIVSIILFFVPFLQTAASRLANYNKEFVTPPKFTFDVIPGNANITKGESLTITIKINGENQSRISLFTKSIEETEFTELVLQADSSGNFKHTVNSLNNTFEYFASALNIESSVYKIDVINRPVIREMEIAISSPRYAQMPRSFQKDNGNISALPGSNVQLEVISTKKLLSSEIVFSDSTKKQLQVNDNKAILNFRINKSVDYYIYIVDSEGNYNNNPVVYSISALIDEYPILDVISPNEDVKLSNQNNISLHNKISDDYGFSKLVLNYKLSESRYEMPWDKFSQIEIPFNNNSKEEEVFYNWNLSPLNLAVEDVVSYFIEVYDNDNINGPKSAKSKMFNIRIPSLDELFNKADETQLAAENDLSETLREAEKLSKEFEKISDELKQDSKELSFEEKERIKNALNKFEELGNKVEDVQKQLSKMQESLQENDLLSKETLEKYMELQQLMDELTGEEYKDALQKMQEMMEKLQRDQAQNSFENMKLNEENFKKSIERTLNLLKRIQIEQKVDELLKRSESLTQKQEDLQKQTNQSEQSGDNKDNLNKKQDEISKELKDFKEELEKLRDKLSEVPDMPQEEMQKLMDELEKQNNENLSKEASEQLKQDKMQKAMQMQQQISENMSQMNQQLQNLQQQMQMQNQMQTLQDMMKIIDNVLAVSKEQEELKDAMKDLSFNSPQLNQNAQKQNELKNNLSKILQQMGSTAQKTFAITPEMAKAIGKALSDMNQSISSMQNGNSSGAMKDQNSAMANLNEAASMMNNMMNSMMSGGGAGGGMMSLMQQMQQLSQQQMQLNQLTQMLNKGMLSQDQMGQLQRLSQEQEIIRKSLEQLNKESKESGQSKKMPANLDRILQDMQEVISDMQTQKLGDDLIQKQERILSKLLDAQKSINERDFEKERESFAGKNIKRDSPSQLQLNSQEGKDKLRDELLKAIREGYLKDYEDLIRRYYEALQKDNVK